MLVSGYIVLVVAMVTTREYQEPGYSCIASASTIMVKVARSPETRGTWAENPQKALTALWDSLGLSKGAMFAPMLSS